MELIESTVEALTPLHHNHTVPNKAAVFQLTGCVWRLRHDHLGGNPK